VAGAEAEGVRSAPFRADFLDDAGGQADSWFETCRGVPLDATSAKAAGTAYTDRVAIAERLARQDEALLAHLIDGDPDLDDTAFALPEARTTDGSPALSDVPGFPAPVAVVPQRPAPDGLSGSQVAVWTAVVDGAEKVPELAAAAGLGTSQTYKLLAELVDAGHIVKAAHGRYRTVDADQADAVPGGQDR